MLKKAAAADARLAAARVDVPEDEFAQISQEAERNERTVAAIEVEELAGKFQWQWSLT